MKKGWGRTTLNHSPGAGVQWDTEYEWGVRQMHKYKRPSPETGGAWVHSLSTEVFCSAIYRKHLSYFDFSKCRLLWLSQRGQTQWKFSPENKLSLSTIGCESGVVKWREQLKSMTIFSFLPRVACPVNRLHSDACSAREHPWASWLLSWGHTNCFY